MAYMPDIERSWRAEGLDAGREQGREEGKREVVLLRMRIAEGPGALAGRIAAADALDHPHRPHRPRCNAVRYLAW